MFNLLNPLVFILLNALSVNQNFSYTALQLIICEAQEEEKLSLGLDLPFSFDAHTSASLYKVYSGCL